MDMNGVTREEAVLFLLSLQDQIDLIAQYRKDEYDQIVQLQRGDSFYIKAHFNYDQTEKGEMSFKKSDVFHVVDTLHNGVVGSWQAFRMGRRYHPAVKLIHSFLISFQIHFSPDSVVQLNRSRRG